MINKLIYYTLKKAGTVVKKILFLAIDCKSQERTSEKLYKLLIKLKHPFAAYKVCLISESFQLNNERQSAKTVKESLRYIQSNYCLG